MAAWQVGLGAVGIMCVQACGDVSSSSAGVLRAAPNSQQAAIAVGCGNRSIESGEACDDGNQRGGDGCAADCQSIEAGFVCDWKSASCRPLMQLLEPFCGNGQVDSGEICDDGNLQAGDGCGEACQYIEPNYLCPAAGGPCRAPLCGDGQQDGNETCDDGNLEVLDGCSGTCQVEVGYQCPNPGLACEADPSQRGAAPELTNDAALIGESAVPIADQDAGPAIDASSAQDAASDAALLDAGK